MKKFRMKRTPMTVKTFQENEDGDKEALTKAIDRTTTLVLSAPLSDKSNEMQRMFFRAAVSGTDWRLYAERGETRIVTFQQYIDNLFAAIRTMDRHKT